MARINLTAGRIRNFITNEAQAFLWDTEAPGLAVRATPSSRSHPDGLRAFIFQAKLAGKAIRITIGDAKSWGIDEARAEARRLQTLIDQGIDPRQAKAEEMAAAEARKAEQAAKVQANEDEARRLGLKVADAWAAYIEYQQDRMGRKNIERGKKWGARHLLDHQRMTQAGGEERKRSKEKTKPGPLYPLLQLRLADIRAETLKEWQRTEAETRPNAARQAFEAFRTFWRWCAAHPDYSGAIDAGAVEGRDVRDEVPSRKAKEADALQREQLPTWFAAVREIGNPIISAYLQALLLTGARREELAGLTWEDCDFQWRSLRIHDKVTGERTIPLTPYVALLIAALPRRNQWVFSSPTAETGRIQEPRIAHTRALESSGLPHVSLHGLRRSFGTLAEWVECPTGVVAQIMGHKPSAIAEKHYRRRPLDLLRMWHVRIEAWMLEQAGIPQPVEEDQNLRLVAG